MPSGCNVKPGPIQVEKNKYKNTLYAIFCIQYAFPAVASFHLIKAELLLPSVQGSDVWNQAVITSALFHPCFNVATSSTGAWEVQGARPAGILGHSSHCKAQLCDDMQFCLVTQVPSKARCQSRCASSVPTAVAITRSHAARETTPSAASLFVCVHCRRKICASSG